MKPPSSFFELYNYASEGVRLQERIGNPTAGIGNLATEVDEKQLPTFHGTANSRKQDRENNDNSNGSQPGSSQSSDSRVRDSVFDDPIVQSVLSSARYSVAEAWVELGMVPLDRVSHVLAKSHVLIVNP